MNTKSPRLDLGFTLVELMITIMIVGILTALAIPSYKGYVYNSKLSEAYNMLDTLGKNEITYFSTNGEFNHMTTANPVNLADTMTVATDSAWATLGYPSNPGSRVYFSYRAKAGKSDSSGTELTSAGSSVSGNGFTTISDGTLLAANYSGSSNCYSAGYSAVSFGATSQSSYNWLVLAAVGDLYNDHDSSCTGIVHYMDVPLSGARRAGPTYRGGFVLIREGTVSGTTTTSGTTTASTASTTSTTSTTTTTTTTGRTTTGRASPGN